MFTFDKNANSPSDAKSGPMEEAIRSINFVSSRESTRLPTGSQPMQVEYPFSHPFGQVFQRSRRTRSCPTDRHNRLAQRFVDKAGPGWLAPASLRQSVRVGRLK
jgi:hypothetical protein